MMLGGQQAQSNQARRPCAGLALLVGVRVAAQLQRVDVEVLGRRQGDAGAGTR